VLHSADLGCSLSRRESLCPYRLKCMHYWGSKLLASQVSRQLALVGRDGSLFESIASCNQACLTPVLRPCYESLCAAKCRCAPAFSMYCQHGIYALHAVDVCHKIKCTGGSATSRDWLVKAMCTSTLRSNYGCEWRLCASGAYISRSVQPHCILRLLLGFCTSSASYSTLLTDRLVLSCSPSF